ncbi:Os04g0568300, partial [Oryza sativa Japonica Group]
AFSLISSQLDESNPFFNNRAAPRSRDDAAAAVLARRDHQPRTRAGLPAAASLRGRKPKPFLGFQSERARARIPSRPGAFLDLSGRRIPGYFRAGKGSGTCGLDAIRQDYFGFNSLKLFFAARQLTRTLEQ